MEMVLQQKYLQHKILTDLIKPKLEHALTKKRRQRKKILLAFPWKRFKSFHLVESELAKTLHGVSDGCWGPAKGQATDSLLGHRQLEAVAKGLVLLLVHLGRKKKKQS